MSNWYREIVTLLEGAAPAAEKEPCIPRIAIYTDDGKRNYEAILFFPAADANLGKIVCYAHVGQHSEASMMFFSQHTAKPTEKNLAKAGLSKADFVDLIKEWENMGPEHTPVKLYDRDQPAFRDKRWPRR